MEWWVVDMDVPDMYDLVWKQPALEAWSFSLPEWGFHEEEGARHMGYMYPHHQGRREREDALSSDDGNRPDTASAKVPPETSMYSLALSSGWY